MSFNIDPNVSFTLPPAKDGTERKAILDAYELVTFTGQLYATKGVKDTPDSAPTLTYDIIVGETTSFVENKTGVKLTPGEAIGVFEHAQKAWEAKKKTWRQGDLAEKSETSPDSMDPRLCD